MRIPLKVKQAWEFLWHGKSISSYLAFIIVSFLLLKFVVYPGFLMVTGWEDVVAVLSSSMEHGGNIGTTFYSWLDGKGYEYADWPFQGGLNIGDAVVVVRVPASDISVGDVIVFASGTGDMIIHRVIEKNGTTFTTKGDANMDSISFEKGIQYERIVGKAVGVVPLVGYPRVLMSRLLGL